MILALCALWVFAPAAGFISFSPEDALFYRMNVGSTWGSTLSQYFHLNWTWYRPTSFNLSYHLLTRFLDWHQLLAFKAVNFALFIALAITFYRLARVAFESVGAPRERSRLAALAAAIWFVCLPLHHTPTYNVTAFDSLHQLILFESARRFALYHLAKVSGRLHEARVAWVGSFALYLIGLTTKEVVIALPVFLGAILALKTWATRPLGPRGGNRWRAIRDISRPLLPFVVVTVGYLTLRLAGQPGIDDVDYRTRFRPLEILKSAHKLVEWTTRYFPRTDLHELPYHRPVDNAVGLVSLVLLIVLAARAYRTDPVFRRLLPGIAITIACFGAIPVYSGGYPWHFSLSAAGYAVGLGYLVSGLTFVKWMPAALAVGLMAVAQDDFRQFMHKGPDSGTYVMNFHALHHPPIDPGALEPDTTLLIENRSGIPSWGYGKGNLFAYVYQKPDISQLSLTEVSPSELRRLAAIERGLHCIDWHAEERRWIDHTPGCRDRLSALAKAGLR